MTEATLKQQVNKFLDTVWPCRQAVRAINENTAMTNSLHDSVDELNATLIGNRTRKKMSEISDGG